MAVYVTPQHANTLPIAADSAAANHHAFATDLANQRIPARYPTISSLASDATYCVACPATR